MIRMDEAVSHVLEGKSAMGAFTLSARVQFKREPDAIAALSRACEQLREDISTSVDLETDEDLTSFIVKLANYCCKQGWDTQDKLSSGFNAVRLDLVDALLEAPELLRSKAGIKGILSRHYQRASQQSARLRKTLIDNPDHQAPPLEILNAGDCQLVELLSPYHLQQESAALGHCVGTSYNDVVLAQKGLKKGGCVVIKDNVARLSPALDKEDMSVTRYAL